MLKPERLLLLVKCFCRRSRAANAIKGCCLGFVDQKQLLKLLHKMHNFINCKYEGGGGVFCKNVFSSNEMEA